MTPALIILALVFFLATMVLVVRSLGGVVALAGQSAALQFDEAELLNLVAAKRGALTALKETELDFETGKVGETEYRELHTVASAEAIEVMKKLDAVRTRFRYTKRIDADLEALGVGTADAPAPLDSTPSLLAATQPGDGRDQLSEAGRIRARRRAAAEPGASVSAGSGSGGFCVACGVSLVAGARFCGECGHAVGAPLGERA